CSLVYNVAWVF
nr:immunoglobulin light chain junction region [Macaca mulatta]